MVWWYHYFMEEQQEESNSQESQTPVPNEETSVSLPAAKKFVVKMLVVFILIIAMALIGVYFLLILPGNISNNSKTNELTVSNDSGENIEKESVIANTEIEDTSSISDKSDSDLVETVVEDPTLNPSVYVTPKGTSLLMPPYNWKPTVIFDFPSKPAATVIFVNPNNEEETLGVILVPALKGYDLDEDRRETEDEFISSGGFITESHHTTLNNRSGYIVEAQFSKTGRYMRIIAISTETKNYLISGSSLIEDWDAYSSLYNASIATLQMD